MELFATFFAGLGLLFIGIHFIGDNLKRLTGRNFRRRVTIATKSHFSAASVGILAGGLTQSSNAVTLIAISMIQAGLAGVSAVMPLVAWSNVGTAGLVLLSAVDLRVMVLFLLGMVGLAYYFNIDRSLKYRHVAGALLGIGLLFFGLQLMKEGAAPLTGMDWVVDLLQLTARHDLLEFLAGLLFALVLQSSATVTIIAVSMVSLGILTFDQSVLLVLGAGLGSGIGAGLTAYNLEGTARQLALSQVLYKFLGAIFILALFYLELYTDVPLLRAAVERVTPELGMQLALIFLIIQVSSALLGSLLQHPLERLCALVSPVAPHEELAKPRYIYQQALDDPESALDLIEREQQDILARFPGLLPVEGEKAPRPEQGQRILDATRSLCTELENFQSELLERRVSGHVLESAMTLQNRNVLLVALCEALENFLHALDKMVDPERYEQAVLEDLVRQEREQGVGLVDTLVEVLHMLLESLRDLGVDGDELDRTLLRSMTGDHSETMESIRRRMLREEAGMEQERREQLFETTRVFEQLVWLIRRYASSISPAEGREAS
ncbi:Na/Pi cotransporter family protein [Fodinicurvata fenggangensis]|uniref:Na/Pi cotransporter family protein n=1 Tax=Fodinicurvata fenggangensis TaxID=1121830 RepID=UPI00047B9A49|nr:Na/Pi symporter [Fodinicurvata fenggangensis]